MSTNSEEILVGESVLERFEAGDIYIPMAGLTWLDITGADRGKILGNITTNHVAALTPGTGCETFITDARGKTFGHALVYALEDRFRLLSVADQFDRLAGQIDRYVIREQVSVEDTSDQFHCIFYPGITGTSLAAKLQPPRRPKPELGFEAREFEGIPVSIFQLPWTSNNDWLLVVDKANAEALDSALIQYDILPGNASLMHCGRIKNRFPWYGLDCDDSNLPQEMDRDDRAINFKKGCYLGQETIARLDALGQVQKKLLLWKFDGQQIPSPGTELRSGEKVVATVTSSAYCFANQAPLALAITRRSHFKPGSAAESEFGTAQVVE